MQRSRRLPIIFAGVALFAAACGAGDAGTGTSGAASSRGATAEDGSREAVAAGNVALLRSNDDPRLVEVLDLDDGSITSLDAAVAGDRPVLLWFWAPH